MAQVVVDNPDGLGSLFFADPTAPAAPPLRRFAPDLAIDGEGSALRYRPKVSCADGCMRGVEAVMDWTLSAPGNGRSVRSEEIAEDSGPGDNVDGLVLGRALIDIGGLIRGGSQMRVAVKVTTMAAEGSSFAEEIVEALRAIEFPPRRLELEIAASLAARIPDLLEDRMSMLRQIGIRLVLGDFGGGYSNFDSLFKLSFDTVKLDCSLVSGVAADRKAQSILRSALRLANELGFETIVEGVDSDEDLRFAAENGATMAQGPLFGPPLSFGELSAQSERDLRAASGLRRARSGGQADTAAQFPLRSDCP